MTGGAGCSSGKQRRAESRSKTLRARQTQRSQQQQTATANKSQIVRPRPGPGTTAPPVSQLVSQPASQSAASSWALEPHLQVLQRGPRELRVAHASVPSHAAAGDVAAHHVVSAQAGDLGQRPGRGAEGGAGCQGAPGSSAGGVGPSARPAAPRHEPAGAPVPKALFSPTHPLSASPITAACPTTMTATCSP